MTIKVVEGKILVSRSDTEEVTSSGILISTTTSGNTSEHVVVNSGVDYLDDGDSVVCERPGVMWEPESGKDKVGITEASNALLKWDGIEWRVLRNDILLQLKSSNSTRGGLIYIKDDPDKENLQTFQVIDIGPDCVDVAIGDLVVVPWLRITPPFTIKGYETYGVTSEEEVLAVVEG